MRGATLKTWRGLCVIATVAIIAPLDAQQAPPPQGPMGTGMITGQVIDSDTGRGIPQALVALVGAPQTGQGRAGSPIAAPAGRGVPMRPFAVIADSQGRFVFGGLPAGTFVVQSELHGYTSSMLGTTVEVADGARADVKLGLRRLLDITGRVADDSGAPVVGVEVIAFRRLSSLGRPASLTPLFRTRTDDRGEYRLTNLSPDTYWVCACTHDAIPFDGHLLTTLAGRPIDLLALAGRAVTSGADTASLDPAMRTYPVTLHPSSTTVSGAEAVRLTPGHDRSGVDITLTAVAARRVSGRILGASGAVSANMLRLRAVGDTREASSLTQLLPMLVQPDGRFDFANVPPGQYVLEVTFRPGSRGAGPSGLALGFLGARGQAMNPPPPPPARGGGPLDPALDPLWAQELVSVGDRDVTGLTISLNRSLVVSGRVVFSGASPQPQPQMLQRPLLQLVSHEVGPLARVHSTGLQADGSFELRGVLPGRYVLTLPPSLPGWPTLKSMVGRDGEFTDTTLELSTDFTNVTITVTDAPAAQAEVHVQPAPRDDNDVVWVRVFPADRRQWADPFANQRRYRALRVNAKGVVTLTSMPSGEYLVATATDNASDWTSLESLESLLRSAERLRLGEGDKVTVEVRR